MSTYYSDDQVTLYHGDWRDLIGSLEADLIVTDPPYGETSLDWDTWPDGWPALAARHARSMWCFGSMRMLLRQRDQFADWKLSHDVVWEKHNGSIFHADRFRRVHEHALHEWSSIHHEPPTTPDATARTVRRKGRPAHSGDVGASTYQKEDGGPRQHNQRDREAGRPARTPDHLWVSARRAGRRPVCRLGLDWSSGETGGPPGGLV